MYIGTFQQLVMKNHYANKTGWVTISNHEFNSSKSALEEKSFRAGLK
jgi:hypothetical protein